MAFKVGERVRATSRGMVHFDQKGTIEGPHFDGVESYWVKWDGDPWHTYAPACNLELVETLKLEVGATVTIGDGKDEWLVARELPSLMPGQFEINRPGVTFWAHPRNLTVVKAKPEPPKPDYYVNCKGAEPKDGDVFSAQGEIAAVTGGRYKYIFGSCVPDSYPLDGELGSHSLAHHRKHPRTLVVRDGKPYTGNV